MFVFVFVCIFVYESCACTVFVQVADAMSTSWASSSLSFRSSAVSDAPPALSASLPLGQVPWPCVGGYPAIKTRLLQLVAWPMMHPGKLVEFGVSALLLLVSLSFLLFVALPSLSPTSFRLAYVCYPLHGCVSPLLCFVACGRGGLPCTPSPARATAPSVVWLVFSSSLCKCHPFPGVREKANSPPPPSPPTPGVIRQGRVVARALRLWQDCPRIRPRLPVPCTLTDPQRPRGHVQIPG